MNMNMDRSHGAAMNMDMALPDMHAAMNMAVVVCTLATSLRIHTNSSCPEQNRPGG